MVILACCHCHRYFRDLANEVGQPLTLHLEGGVKVSGILERVLDKGVDHRVAKDGLLHRHRLYSLIVNSEEYEADSILDLES